MPWGEFFKSAPVWAVIVAHFCFNWGYYTLLAWLPSYFELALGLGEQDGALGTGRHAHAWCHHPSRLSVAL